MVVCAVKLCRNYTGKNIKPPEGISFHRFPTDEDQKQEWIRAIQREPEWVPGTHCRVCSVHFEASDFKISETGRRILHKDAIPTKNLYHEERHDSVAAPRRRTPRARREWGAGEQLCACRGCLAVRPAAAMPPLCARAAAALAALTDVQVTPTDGFPQNLCQCCFALLVKLAAFRARTRTAQSVLEQAASRNLQITPEYLLTIDREKHNLTLPLSIKPLPHLDVSETDYDVKTEQFDVIMQDLTDDVENDMSNVEAIEDDNEMSNGFDIFDERNGILTDLAETEQKLFDANVKIEHNQFVLESEEGKSAVYASIVPKHEIFVEVDAKKLIKAEKKRKDLKRKSKKIKKEKNLILNACKSKEDIRNTKPRKTGEDYERFARDHRVDIVFLTREQQLAEVEARKESDNYKNSRFKCEDCYKGFTGEAAFRNHRAIHDPSVGSYACEACKFRFPKRYKLLHHLTQHKMNFICQLCGHVSKLASKAMEHYKWHNGVKYPCHYCDRIFIKRTSQFNHMRNRHGSSVCDICQEIFSGERGLTAHMQKAHKEAVKSKCESCGVQFHSEAALAAHLEGLPGGVCGDYVKACAECGDNFDAEEALNEHMRSTHWKEIKCEKCNANFENEKLYRMHRVIHKEVRVRKPRECAGAGKAALAAGGKHAHIQRRMCEMCGLTWRSAAALKYHQRVHTGEKPHQCPLCPKAFRIQDSLQIHMNTHTGARPFQCPHCPKAFKSRTQNHKHQLYKPHQCPLCPKAFRIQDSLQIHMNTHTGARPFQCPHCPKAFKSRTQNHKHQLVHTKVRRYRCDLCDKTFQTSTCVKTHIRAVHMKLPPPRARRPALCAAAGEPPHELATGHT